MFSNGFYDNNCISAVMVNMLAWSVVDCGVKPRSGQSKNFKIGISCSMLDWIQDSVSEWSDMSTKWTSSSSSHLNKTCSRHNIAEKFLTWH
jgi:hypothetical protein